VQDHLLSRRFNKPSIPVSAYLKDDESIQIAERRSSGSTYHHHIHLSSSLVESLAAR
jgi:hypothetical protein